MREEAARRARRDVERLTHSGLEWNTMCFELADAIRRVVPVDRHCWHSLDPGTLVLTGAVAEGLGEEPRLTEFEYAIPDFNKWSFLARSMWPVGILSQATRGNLEASARYRDLLNPRGVRHELRGSFASDGEAWGCSGLFRDAGREDFDDEEAAFFASLTSQIADGFRRANLLAGAFDPGPDTPGLVLYDEHGKLEAVNEAAAAWMEQIVDEIHPGVAPHVIEGVARLARMAGDSPDIQRTARARTWTRGGTWLLLYGTRIGGPDSTRVAVILEPAKPAEVAPLIVAAYGLTEREREVTKLCIHGASTAEIAGAMHISPHTVQDHLKSIFEKVGVRSRRELVARLVGEQFDPRIRPMPNGDGFEIDLAQPV